jgi:sec-independent protein translocase protein TatC
MSQVAPEGVAWMTDIDKYLSFVLSTFVAFGVTFEVPVVVIVLVRMGIVDIAKLKEWRPYVIVGAFVLGAIFTPPDVVSQIMLAVPLWLLYELGILLARFIGVAPPRSAHPQATPQAEAVATTGAAWSQTSDAEMDRVVEDIDRQTNEPPNK